MSTTPVREGRTLRPRPAQEVPMPARHAAVPVLDPTLTAHSPDPAGPALLPDEPPGPPEPPPTGRGRHRRRDAAHRRTLLAVGYLRRSTDRQEQSIPDQQRAVEAYCAEHGLRLLRCYTDDAISGTSAVGRRAFQAMLAAAQRPGCDFGVIVVYDVKRFGRVGNDEAGYYRHLLRQHGVEVRYASEGFTGESTDDLLRPVKQWQARQESKDLSKVTIRGLLTKSTTGHWMGGAPPFGYDLRYTSQSGQFLFVLRYKADGTKRMLDEQGKLVRTLERGESVAVSRRDHCVLVPGEESRAETIRTIFRLYAEEGRGFKAIADRLNREGVPTARGPQWAGHYSGQWSLTTVRAILLNPAYCGDMVWNRRTDARFHRIGQGRAVERQDAHARRLEDNDPGDWAVVRDAHEPLVSRRLWQTAKAMLEGKRASLEQRGVDPRTGEAAGDLDARPPAFVAAGDACGPRAKFLLSKLVRCGSCGSVYEGYTQRSRRRDESGERHKELFYACGGYIRRGKSVCSLGQVGKEKLEGAVAGAVLSCYGRYRDEAGKGVLAEEIRRAVGHEEEGLVERKGRLQEETRRLERTERNLLDNITPGTQEAVERRLKELQGERAKLEREVEGLERLWLSGDEVRHLIAETHAFLAGLEGTLKEGPLAARHTALRRCVEKVVLEREEERVTVRVRAPPVMLGREDRFVHDVRTVLHAASISR